MNTARKKNTKQDVNGKMIFFSSPGNPQKDYVDENTNSMFGGIKILQNEENVQYDFRKTIVEKDHKKTKIKREKKENQLYSNLKNYLEKEI